ncbi:AraC family transcriptional regulator [Nocardiopsis exhalans]|uniref:AraC family transcriptional regulator n=1 Tax=Nocardiopsis exhalans TaxID=163604 RepID=A0ABY5D465_9ACTN|nr:AraC family transcriptional regulator [Nocardiopsis exhalans]USY18780.1 AraC family transcriptional regulator [Nocardiopsis exhalans]
MEVRYEPPGGDAGGIEVMSFGQLHRRLRRRPGMEMAQRLDFHQLLTVQQGMVRHMVDFTDYMATPGAWLWVRPGQVQQFHDLTSGSGWLVLFQSGVLDAATSAQTGLDDLFGRVHWELAGDDAAAMEEALGHLVHEYESTASLPAALRARILQHLLAVVMLRLTYQTTQVGSPTADHPEAFVRFRSAVEERFARARNVNDYARALGYSPRTLSRATTASAGVGAKEFIDRRVVLEAKRLLAHEEDPIGRVADRLGFDDASNFVKYFTQRTGLTPSAFRHRFRAG